MEAINYFDMYVNNNLHFFFTWILYIWLFFFKPDSGKNSADRPPVGRQWCSRNESKHKIDKCNINFNRFRYKRIRQKENDVYFLLCIQIQTTAGNHRVADWRDAITLRKHAYSNILKS